MERMMAVLDIILTAIKAAYIVFKLYELYEAIKAKKISRPPNE